MRRGDRVVIVSPDGIPTVIALFAISRLGAITVITHEDIKDYFLQHILEDCDPRVVLMNARLRNRHSLEGGRTVITLDDNWDATPFADARPVATEIISCDPAFLIYTSGSTSMPKAVISTHANVCFTVSAIQERLHIDKSDVIGNFITLSFDYGLYQIFLSLAVGATLAMGSDMKNLGVKLHVILTDWHVTVLPVVPALAAVLIRLLKRVGADTSRLRMITSTGAHLPEACINDLKGLLPHCGIFPMFGLTECKRVSILTPEEYERKPGSVGRPLQDTECLIVDDRAEPLPPGTVGELVVRGPHVTSGYWKSPELTGQRFRVWGSGVERALFTGDMCSMDEDGYLTFHGRTDDIYSQHGSRISVLEVEAAARDISGVSEAAVLPPEEGKPATLFVATYLPPTTVLEQLRQRLEDFRIPEAIVPVEELPLNSNGKVDKAALRSQPKAEGL